LALPQGEGKMIKPTKRIDLVKWYGGIHYRKNLESLWDMKQYRLEKHEESKNKHKQRQSEPCSMGEWKKVRGRGNYGT